MKRTAVQVLCVVSLAVLPAWGSRYYIDGSTVSPPNPVAGQPITIDIRGSWSDSCLPDRAEVVREGSDIYLNFIQENPYEACLMVIMAWNPRLHLRGLPAGTYDVYVAHYEEGGAWSPFGGLVQGPDYLTTFVVDPIDRIGDIDGDGTVNVFDVMVIAEAWNTRTGDPAFDPRCDLDGDRAVNVFDIFVLAENWGSMP